MFSITLNTLKVLSQLRTTEPLWTTTFSLIWSKSRNFLALSVGDQDNDYEMIRDVGLGIVVGSESEKLAQVGNFKLPALFEGGMEQLLKFLETEIKTV